MSAEPPARVLPPVTSSQQQAAAVGQQAARAAQRQMEEEQRGDSTKPAGDGAPPSPTKPVVMAGAAPQAPTIKKTTLGALTAAVENANDDGTDRIDEFDAGAFLKKKVPQKRVTGAAMAGAIMKRMGNA